MILNYLFSYHDYIFFPSKTKDSKNVYYKKKKLKAEVSTVLIVKIQTYQ